MAERRMFAKTIIDSDAFLDMSVTARLLYYDLSMRADDDGFNNSPKKIMRMVGASDDDLKALIARKFIIPFESGVVVIRHWRIHNYIRKDTYHETTCLEEKKQLAIDKTKAYLPLEGLDLNEIEVEAQPLIVDVSSTARLRKDNGKNEICENADKTGLFDHRQRPVDDPSTQVRLGKDRLGKSSSGKNKYGEYSHVLLSDEDIQKLNIQFGEERTQEAITYLDEYMEMTGKKYKNCYLAMRKWVFDALDKKKQPQPQQNTAGSSTSDYLRQKLAEAEMRETNNDGS